MTSSDAGEAPRPAVPPPSAPGEVITAIVHFHRAEIGRMTSWRDRIDRTSNWAITAAAAMLSLSLSTPSAHHGVLIFAMLLILLLLWIEARRYRFFDVYRTRVRQLERHYFAQIFSPAKDFAAGWQQALGESLRQPRFRISQADAFSRRLRRNYIWMFLILLVAWVLKISTPALQQEGVQPTLVRSAREAVAHAALGPLPGWSVLVFLVIFYGGLAYACLRGTGESDMQSDGEVHV